MSPDNRPSLSRRDFLKVAGGAFGAFLLNSCFGSVKETQDQGFAGSLEATPTKLPPTEAPYVYPEARTWGIDEAELGQTGLRFADPKNVLHYEEKQDENGVLRILPVEGNLGLTVVGGMNIEFEPGSNRGMKVLFLASEEGKVEKAAVQTNDGFLILDYQRVNDDKSDKSFDYFGWWGELVDNKGQRVPWMVPVLVAEVDENGQVVPGEVYGYNAETNEMYRLVPAHPEGQKSANALFSMVLTEDQQVRLLLGQQAAQEAGLEGWRYEWKKDEESGEARMVILDQNGEEAMYWDAEASGWQEVVVEVPYGENYALRKGVVVYRAADGTERPTPVRVSGKTARFAFEGQEVEVPAEEIGYHELFGREDILVVRDQETGKIKFFYSTVTGEMMTPLEVQRDYRNVDAYTPITFEDVSSGRVRDSELLLAGIAFPPEAKFLGIEPQYSPSFGASYAFFKVADVKDQKTWPMRPGGKYLLADGEGHFSRFVAIHILNADGSVSVLMGSGSFRKKKTDEWYVNRQGVWEEGEYPSHPEQEVPMLMIGAVEYHDWSSGFPKKIEESFYSQEQKAAEEEWLATGKLPDYMERTPQILTGYQYMYAKYFMAVEP